MFGLGWSLTRSAESDDESEVSELTRLMSLVTVNFGINRTKKTPKKIQY